ncbi:DNA polymerase III subunit gamma and tau [Metamycoplasma auris 15026]|uniref:DNA polymerase III subunit gamma/tau n=1 Tax=Metamycoplasma auris 15026 TaxID=1188233 RepID=N9TR24_9BACT|nr:DNA polymerase III subunit gamma/tau [Metamycoplasma auris]ENY68604.1 DNA polymerase III subunit gamma and tau [Metamycoplasma auris 15026]
MSFEKKYLALYRQYRPKIFDEVYGQKSIIESLKNIIKENKLTHAYLFCGPHGNGKTSTAKIFANAINCSHRIDENPCEQCINDLNQNIDIIEIDAASNTGIDDIRELREKIKHLPAKSKYKIYIIDEVHMLSKAAFNALLKTIEEPPKHVIFILATTDPQKIPLTILSRVQRFNFKKIDKETLFFQLSNIFKKENINANEDAIKLIIDLGNGSFRDTLSIADQVSIYCANQLITKEAIEELYGIVDINNILYLLNAIKNHNHQDLIKKYNYLIENGASIEKLLMQIFKLLKDYYVWKKTNDLSLLEFNQKSNLSTLAFDDDSLSFYLELIQKAMIEIKNSDIPKQIFELYLLKMASYNDFYTNQVVQEEKFKDLAYEEVYSDNKTIETPNNSWDKEIVTEKKDINANELRNKSPIEQFNDVFNLANISNSYDKQPQPKIIEKSNDLLENNNKNNSITQENKNKKQTTNISDLSKINRHENFLDNIINPEYTSFNEEKNIDILKPEINQEDINKLAFIYQYIKLGLYNWEQSKSQINLDATYFNMIKTKLQEKYPHLIELLAAFKILFSTQDFIVLKSDDLSKVHQLNLRANTEDLIEATNLIFNRYLNVIAISQKQFDIAKDYCLKNWKDLKEKEIKMFELPSLDKYKNKESETYEYAKKLFGDIVKKPQS